nr:hypothetical protein [Pseudomonas aeruginosa]
MLLGRFGPGVGLDLRLGVALGLLGHGGNRLGGLLDGGLQVITLGGHVIEAPEHHRRLPGRPPTMAARSLVDPPANLEHERLLLIEHRVDDALNDREQRDDHLKRRPLGERQGAIAIDIPQPHRYAVIAPWCEAPMRRASAFVVNPSIIPP